MNNARLTPLVVVIAILIGTMVGPFETLKDVTSEQLQDKGYWFDVLASTVRAFAAAALAGIGLVAGLLGLPLLRGGSMEQPGGGTLTAASEGKSVPRPEPNPPAVDNQR